MELGQKRVRNLRVFPFIVVASLLVISSSMSSCSSSDALEKGFREEEYTPASLLRRVETEPERVIEAVAQWHLRRGGESTKSLATEAGTSDEYSRLAEAATMRLATDFLSALERKDWDAASRLKTSLETISFLSFPSFSRASGIAIQALADQRASSIERQKAEVFLSAGWLPPALILLKRSLEVEKGSGIDPLSLAPWIEAIQKRSDPALSAFLDSLIRGGLEGGSGGKGSVEPSFQARGVVTVSVDKGLQIESGVGYPDRVLGSAFQVDASGYYLTNYHVVSSEVDPEYEGFSRLSIRPPDKPEARIPARVVGWNKALDLALIQSAETMPYSFFPGLPARVQAGERVRAIGSPVGLENSMSSGIVSASGRRILQRGEALQIDAPLNPGNSGGPLITESGRLAGIVFAGLRDFQGLNFALPASWIELALPGLYSGGESRNPSLAVAVVRNLDGSFTVSYAPPGSLMLRQQDRILSIQGKKLESLDQGRAQLALMPEGSLCCVELEREGRVIRLPVLVSALEDISPKRLVKTDSVENLIFGISGAVFEHISGSRGQGGTYKLLKAWPGQLADEAGLAEGDVVKIVRVDIDAGSRAIVFDLLVKSPTKGYLEKAMRLGASLELDNIL
ncbi:MAG TPA: trypsin-like peptidase domain-containing protein [Rectinemataceae bacterium]